jgi:glycosyltransferase involved in cell wall biosynthesis
MSNVLQKKHSKVYCFYKNNKPLLYDDIKVSKVSKVSNINYVSVNDKIRDNSTISDLKIYIINQEHRIDRNEHMISQLKYINHTNYEFFKAYDEKNKCVVDDHTKMLNYYKNNTDIKQRLYNIGTVGLIYSTIKLFEHINNNTDNDYVVILEDDIFFINDFVDLFSFNKENTDFHYIGYNQYNTELCKTYKNTEDIININSVSIYNNNCFYGTYGYICNKKFRDIAIKLGVSYCLDNNYTIDYAFNWIRKKNSEELNFTILGGKQLIIPNIYDEVCINNNRETIIKNDWYVYRHIDVKEYYNFYKKQNNFVFIIPSFNNELNVKNNLESIINQKNYNNWKIIYINDCSTDRTEELFFSITKNYENKVTYIKNKKKMGQAFNRYQGYNMCDDEDMCILLDGDDWLYGNFVLSYLNDFINNNDIYMTYRNFKNFDNDKILNGYTVDDYSTNTMLNKSYRKDIWRAGHLRLIKAILLKKISFYDLIDNYYDFILVSTDMNESYACLELSNGKHKINRHYICVYNRSNSIKYNTSYYKEKTLKNSYRSIINNNIKNNTRYINYIENKKDYLCIININNNNYKININKYKHELENTHNLLVINIDYINLYQDKIKNHINYIVLNDYIEQSLCDNNYIYKSIKPDDNYESHTLKNIETKNLITVIIACYNCDRFVNDTIVSLMNQTNKNFEVVFVNDCSPDNTFNILNNLKKLPFNYKVINNNTNIGYAYTLAKGIANSNTKYIITLDSDDIIDITTIEKLYYYINKHNYPGFMYSNFYYCDEKLNVISKGFCKQVIKSNIDENCISQLRVFHKKIYYEAPCYGYLEDGNMYKNGAGDKDIYFKIEETTKPIYIDEYLYFYRKHNSSITHVNNKCIKEFEIAKNNYRTRLEYKKNKMDFINGL